MKYGESVKSENKTSNLFSDNEESVLDNKPVQAWINLYLNRYTWISSKVLVFNHRNCQQRIILKSLKKV